MNKRDPLSGSAPPPLRVEAPVDLGTSPFRRAPTSTHPAQPRSVAFGDPATSADGKTESVPMSEMAEMLGMPVAAPIADLSSLDSIPEEATSPGMRPAALVAEEAVEAKRGEIAQLLAAVGPFLWSLEEATKWANNLAEAGDGSALQHARSLGLLAKILAQLQSRIDELSKL